MALVVQVGGVEAVWDGDHWATDDQTGIVLDILNDFTNQYRQGGVGFVGYAPNPDHMFGMWLEKMHSSIRVIEFDILPELESPEGEQIVY